MTMRRTNTISTLAAWSFGAIFAVVALGATSGDANAQRITFRQSPAQFQDLNNDYIGERPRWHRRTHNEDALWYHRNVSPDHRFLPERFHGMAHDFDPSRQYARHSGDGHFSGRRGGRGHGRQSDHRVTTHSDSQPGGTRIVSQGTSYSDAGSTSQGCSSINAGTLIGAAIGGFAGSQIGGGRGNLAATAGGTLLGALIGGNAGCR